MHCTENLLSGKSKGKEGIEGALDGGVPMSHVEFKKCQCRMSLSLGNHYVPC